MPFTGFNGAEVLFFVADYLDLRDGDSGVGVLIQHPQDQSPQRFTDLWSTETQSKILRHVSETLFMKEHKQIVDRKV